MVQIKLSVAFVLAVAAIASVVAQPIFVESVTSSTSSPARKDAQSSAKVLKGDSKVANLKTEVTVGNNSKFKVKVNHLHNERKLKAHEHYAANRHHTPKVHTHKEQLHKTTNPRHKNLHKQESKHESNRLYGHSDDHKADVRSQHHQLFDETLFKEGLKLKLKTDMSAIPKVARDDSKMFERSFDDSDLEGRDLMVHFNTKHGHYQGPANKGYFNLPPPPAPLRRRDDSEIFERSPPVDNFNLHIGLKRGPGIEV